MALASSGQVRATGLEFESLNFDRLPKDTKGVELSQKNGPVPMWLPRLFHICQVRNFATIKYTTLKVPSGGSTVKALPYLQCGAD